MEQPTKIHFVRLNLYNSTGWIVTNAHKVCVTDCWRLILQYSKGKIAGSFLLLVDTGVPYFSIFHLYTEHLLMVWQQEVRSYRKYSLCWQNFILSSSLLRNEAATGGKTRQMSFQIFFGSFGTDKGETKTLDVNRVVSSANQFNASNDRTVTWNTSRTFTDITVTYHR